MILWCCWIWGTLRRNPPKRIGLQHSRFLNVIFDPSIITSREVYTQPPYRFVPHIQRTNNNPMAVGKFLLLNMQRLDLGWLRLWSSLLNVTGEPVELSWLRLGIYSTALLWRKKYFTYEERTMCVWLSDCTINCNFFERVQRIKTEGAGII